MNILTFDIEEWYLEKVLHGGREEMYSKYNQYLDLILDNLDERGFKATFFCVGGMATEFPDVVKRIYERGHEIGCHSFKHEWLNKMTEKEALEDTRTAVDALEQCIGEKVTSYRAPAFSIGNKNKWALGVLKECGIKRDASVFPAERDFGGFAKYTEKAPALVFFDKAVIKEFPICITKLMGREIAYSGGGYFRFLPISYVKKEMDCREYNMTYFHIADLVPVSVNLKSRKEYEDYFKEPGTLKNRYMRYFKTNFGKKGAFDKFLKLIETENFINLEQADKMINWQEAHSVVL